MALEIETVYVKEDEWAKDVAMEHHVHNQGFDELGGGLYSTVYGSKDSPFAVKLMRGSDNGYISYLETIAELGHDSPYIPKIHRIINYRMVDHEYARENGVQPGRTNRDYFVFYIERLQATRREGRGDCNVKRPIDYFARRLDRLADIAWKDQQFGTKELDWSKYSKKHQDLLALLVLAREVADKYECVGFDLHAGNVMKRGSQFVVTDPLA